MMKTPVLLLIQFVLAGAVFAATPDYSLFRKRYVPLGFEDSKGELAKALVRSDQVWEEDVRSAAECYVEAVGDLNVSTDAALQTRLDAIMEKLIAVSHRPRLKMQVVILESDVINACTYGGDILPHRNDHEPRSSARILFYEGPMAALSSVRCLEEPRSSKGADDVTGRERRKATHRAT